MSWFELLALEKRLTSREREALDWGSRSISVTANSYSGGLHAVTDPTELLQERFDVLASADGLYWRELGIRVPTSAVGLPLWERIASVSGVGTLLYSKDGSHVAFTVTLNDYESSQWGETEQWLPSEITNPLVTVWEASTEGDNRFPLLALISAVLLERIPEDDEVPNINQSLLPLNKDFAGVADFMLIRPEVLAAVHELAETRAGMETLGTVREVRKFINSRLRGVRGIHGIIRPYAFDSNRLGQSYTRDDWDLGQQQRHIQGLAAQHEDIWDGFAAAHKIAPKSHKKALEIIEAMEWKAEGQWEEGRFSELLLDFYYRQRSRPKFRERLVERYPQAEAMAIAQHEAVRKQFDIQVSSR